MRLGWWLPWGSAVAGLWWLRKLLLHCLLLNSWLVWRCPVLLAGGVPGQQVQAKSLARHSPSLIKPKTQISGQKSTYAQYP